MKEAYQKRIILLNCSSVFCLLLVGCQPKSPAVTDDQIATITLSHKFAEEQVVLLSATANEGPRWFANGVLMSRDEIEQYINNLTSKGIASILINYTGEFPLSFLNDTIEIAHKAGIKYISLWNVLDCSFSEQVVDDLSDLRRVTE